MIIAVDMRCLRFVLALLLSVPAGTRADERQDLDALRAAAARHVAGQAAAAGPDTRAEVEVGAIDPRLNLPRCPQPAFALASGSALWGAGSLAVSCPAPAWNLYLTYRTRLTGPALLARRPLPAGSVPGPADLAPGEATYAGDPGRYPRDLAALASGTLARPVAKGSPISIDLLRVRPIIRPGQRVRIVVDGRGFQISREGIAQGQASVGDSLRLKIATGRFVQGTVQPDGSVRIAP